MSEFGLVDRIRKQVSSDDLGVVIGIGDDAAVLDVDPLSQLVVSTDCLLEGIHFLPGQEPGSVGHKALAVNLSDMAAMGASPRWALLSISSPPGEEKWIEETTHGLLDLASVEHVTLVGGDISAGQRAATVTILGTIERGMALTRGGASPGDLVVISGVTGEAAYALESVLAGQDPGVEALGRLHRPLPRVALGKALVGKASACIDISDGLLADLGHIVNASGCGAVLEMDRLPSTPRLDSLPEGRRWDLQISGGDDYELCFTLAPERQDTLRVLADDLGLALTVVGTVREASGVECIDRKGEQWSPVRKGWEHFS